MNMDRQPTFAATRHIAEWISTLRYEHVPERTREVVRRAILDTLGCGVYGYTTPWAQKVLAWTRKGGSVTQATVWGESNRTLRAAEALIKQQPTKSKALRTTLNDAEIKRMAEYVYAKVLAWDERVRYGRDELKRMEAEHIRLEGRPLIGPWAYPYDTLPAHGLSPAQLADDRQQLVSPDR